MVNFIFKMNCALYISVEAQVLFIYVAWTTKGITDKIHCEFENCHTHA